MKNFCHKNCYLNQQMVQTHLKNNYQTSQRQNPLFKMPNLPPGIQQHSSHKLGYLQLSLSHIQVHSTDGIQFTPISYSPIFLGQTTSKLKSQFNCYDKQTTPIYSIAKFDIFTTLWHFYLYLADMDFLEIKVFREEFPEYDYHCKLPILVKEPSHQILNGNFIQNGLLKLSERQIDIWDGAGRIIGKTTVKIQTKFNLQLHQELCDKKVIDFSELLVIEGISRIGSMGSSDHLGSDHPKQQETVRNLSRQFHKIDDHKHLQILPQHSATSQFLPTVKLPPRPPNTDITFPNNFQEDEKMLNQDIDRLVAEMQSKPYDSSRYQQPEDASLANNIQPKVKFVENMRQNRFLQQPSSSSLSSNRIIMESRMPPLPLHRTQTLVSPQIHRKSLSKQRYPPTNRQSSSSIEKVNLYQNSNINTNYRSNPIQQSAFLTTSDIQEFKIHIHELLITGNNVSTTYPFESNTERLSSQRTISEKYWLSIFTVSNYNEQEQLISTLIGTPDSNTVTFNHISQLKNNPRKIEKLRFQLKNVQQQFSRDNDPKARTKEILSEGYFQIDKLLQTNKNNGFFMVPIMHRPQNDIQINRSQLQTFRNEFQNTNSEMKFRKVELPIYRTLRFELQAIENPDKVVQIYLNINNISTFPKEKDYTKVRYKIPYTKQTMEFTKSELEQHNFHNGDSSHFNIFPHSKKFQSLLFEFWHEQSLIGITQISLKGMQSVPYHTMIAGIQPIFLYDSSPSQSSEPQFIYGLANRSQKVGCFDLVLCFGTVKQIQQNMKKQQSLFQNHSSRQRENVQVSLDKKLGVFVKEKKIYSSAEIQVQIESDQDCEPVEAKLTVKPSLKSENSGEKLGKQMGETNSQQQYKSYSDFRSSKITYQLPKGNAQNQFKNSNQAFQKYPNQLSPTFQETTSKPETIKNQSSLSSKSLNSMHKSTSKSDITLKSVLSTISIFIKENLILLIPQETFSSLKQLLKPHALYNFVEIRTLQSVLENIELKEQQTKQSKFLKRKTVKTIIHEILLPKFFISNENQQSDPPMVNVNILYDLMISLQLNQIDHKSSEKSNKIEIKESLIPQFMIGYHVLSILYANFSANLQSSMANQDFLADQQTEWPQLKSQMKENGYKLTMHEFNAVMQYLKTITNKNPHNKTKKDGNHQIMIELRDRIRKQLIEKEFQKDNQKLQEEHIISALYGNQEQSFGGNESISFATSNNQFLNETHKGNLQQYHSEEEMMKETFMPSKISKSNPRESPEQIPSGISEGNYTLKISGLHSCQESASCLFDLDNPQLTFIKLLIKSPLKSELAFSQDSLVLLQRDFNEFLRQEQQLQGQLQLCLPISGQKALGNQLLLSEPVKILGKAAFCIIKGVNSIYAVKTNQEQFCGLINLTLESKQ